MEKPTVLGVDIGGSHITAAIVDLEKGKLVQRSIKRNAVNSSANKEDIFAAWCKVINAAFGACDNSNRSIGIAMPGPFDYQKGISLIKGQDKFDSLYLVNIKEELGRRLDIDPSAIRLINDAAAFMQGEVYGGAAKGYHRVLGLTLGTGLGSAISLNGVSEDADLWSSSFKDGIAEDYLSTRWFVARYHQLTGKEIEGVKELADLAEQDAMAKVLFAEFGENLAQFLIPIIKKYDAETVILGGNIAQAFSLFSARMQHVLANEVQTTVVKKAEMNEYASLIGAASCWVEKDKKNKKVVNH